MSGFSISSCYLRFVFSSLSSVQWFSGCSCGWGMISSPGYSQPDPSLALSLFLQTYKNLSHLLKYTSTGSTLKQKRELKQKERNDCIYISALFSTSLHLQLPFTTPTSPPIPWPHPQTSTCQWSLQCVLSTTCAIMFKDTLLTAMGHCSLGTGWHTLMNDAALAFGLNSSLTNTRGKLAHRKCMHNVTKADCSVV